MMKINEPTEKWSNHRLADRLENLARKLQGYGEAYTTLLYHHRIDGDFAECHEVGECLISEINTMLTELADICEEMNNRLRDGCKNMWDDPYNSDDFDAEN